MLVAELGLGVPRGSVLCFNSYAGLIHASLKELCRTRGEEGARRDVIGSRGYRGAFLPKSLQSLWGELADG